MKVSAKVLVAAVVLPLVAAACSGSVRGGGTTGVQSDKVFTYATPYTAIQSWDPSLASTSELVVLQNVYDSLTKYDTAQKRVVPRLATKWKSSAGGKRWTFTLRSGVKFHSGRVLDAAAVKQSIERTIKLKGGTAYIWDAVESIEAPNSDTVEFRLKYPVALDLVASSSAGAYVYDTKASGSDDFSAWTEKGRDAGTGPYTVASWDKGGETEVQLKKFDGYWGGWKDGQFEGVDYRITPEATTAFQLLQAGEVSMVQRLSPGLIAKAKKNPELAVSHISSFENAIAFYNTASGPLRDVRLRQALQNAIDTKGLAAALKGSTLEPSGLIPEGLLGYTEGAGRQQDLARAKALLEEAGYGPTGKKLKLTLTYSQGDADQQLFVTLLSSSLKSLNVELVAKPLEFNAQWAQGKSDDVDKRQDIFVMFWYPDYADAYSWMSNLFRSSDPVYYNLSYLADPAIDAQIDRIPALTSTDRAATEKLYSQLQNEILNEHAAASPLWVQKYERAYAADIEGYQDNPAYGSVPFVYDMRLRS